MNDRRRGGHRNLSDGGQGGEAAWCGSLCWVRTLWVASIGAAGAVVGIRTTSPDVLDSETSLGFVAHATATALMPA